MTFIHDNLEHVKMSLYSNRFQHCFHGLLTNVAITTKTFMHMQSNLLLKLLAVCYFPVLLWTLNYGIYTNKDDFILIRINYTIKCDHINYSQMFLLDKLPQP